VGGNAGDRDSQPGKGGHGSNCKPDKAGGDGGDGGDAILKDAKAGVGADRNGKLGQTINQTGSNAGDGGDGCLPGEGGTGGVGNPNGANGVIGKNICPAEEKKEDDTGKTGEEVKPEEPKKEEPKIGLNPSGITFEHNIGQTSCPQLAGNVEVSATVEGDEQAVSDWKITSVIPAWLQMPSSGSLGSVPVTFSCVLDEYVTQTLNSNLTFQLIDATGNPVGSPASISVTGYVNAE
jgi:hypothetical protein